MRWTGYAGPNAVIRKARVHLRLVGRATADERGYRGERKADALRDQHGDATVQALVDGVDPSHLGWLASHQFGFH